MNRWSYDIELEQPYTNPQTPDSKLDSPKIIQIGVVFFNIKTKEILEQKKWYINIGVPLSTFIKKLTNITQSEIDQGITIGQAYEELMFLIKKYKAFNQPITWGTGDLQALRSEVMLTGAKWELGHAEFNTKALYQMYSQLNGLKWRGGLATCMERCGLKFQGRAHDALVDSFATMQFCSFLTDKLKNR